MKILTPSHGEIFEKIEEGCGRSSVKDFHREIDSMSRTIPNFRDEYLKHIVIKQMKPHHAAILASQRKNLSSEELAVLAESLQATPDGSVSKVAKKAGSRHSKHKKVKECFYHKNFGTDAKKCQTPDKCPPLVNVLQVSDSTDSE